MAKKRLSQLQKWILTQCYKEGKYDEKEWGLKLDYYIERHELIVRQINEHYKKTGQEKLGKPDYSLRNKLEVATTNSMNNLITKGYIKHNAEFDGWIHKGVWLTDKGAELVKGLFGTK